MGFEFQNTHFIYGISSTHLFSIGKSDTTFLNTNHRYGYAIYKNDNPKFISYSSREYRWLTGIILQFLKATFLSGLSTWQDLLMRPLLKGPQEFLDFGVTYRSSRQLALLCGIMITPYLRIGYAYDQSLFYSYYRNQTHEIMLEYRIPARCCFDCLQVWKQGILVSLKAPPSVIYENTQIKILPCIISFTDLCSSSVWHYCQIQLYKTKQLCTDNSNIHK